MFIVHLNIAVIFFIISMSLLKYTAINIFHILSFNLFSKKITALDLSTLKITALDLSTFYRLYRQFLCFRSLRLI